MSKQEELVTRQGKVVAALNHLMYRVQVDEGPEVLCYSSGKVRRYRIRILVGDRVTVELSPHDLTRGRIVYRH